MKKILAFVCFIIMIVSIMAPSLAADSGTGVAPGSICPKCGAALNAYVGEWRLNSDYHKEVTIGIITYFYYYQTREVNKWCGACGQYSKQHFEYRYYNKEVAWIN